MTIDQINKKNNQESKSEERTFLVLVDNSEEFSPTLRFVCRRAMNTGGRIALLYIIKPAEFQHWIGVGDLMQRESREEAEEMCQVVADIVNKRTGKMPIIFIREGHPHEVLGSLIEEESTFSVLVLGASTGDTGPGPIISYLVNKVAGAFALPITIVPGGLTDEEIDAIT